MKKRIAKISVVLAALLVLVMLPLAAGGGKRRKSNGSHCNGEEPCSLFQHDGKRSFQSGSLVQQTISDVKIEIVNGSAGELTSRIRAERNNPQGDLMGVDSPAATEWFTAISSSIG